MTLATDSELPELDLVDVNGNPGETRELATTGMPVLIVTSAENRFCRTLRDVYADVVALNNGDYEVWMLAQGAPEVVEAAYGELGAGVRLFPFDSGWDGLDALEIEKFPTLIYAGVANKVKGVLEGWDRPVWQETLNELRSFHGWRPVFLERSLPPAAAVPQTATASA